MLEVLSQVVFWLVFIFFGSQAIIFIGFVLWSFWTEAIKPRLTPTADIDNAADKIIAKFADPEKEAFARHEQAWHRCEGAEQAYWYRVRKAVRQRLRDRTNGND